MRRVAVAALLVTALGVAPPDARAADGPQPGLASLVAAERAFAATSVESGMRTAFLAFLSDGATVFRPQPVDAREWFAARPEAAGTLAWEPVYAEISSAGDMGWTTGPYAFRPDDDTRQPGFGHYVSMWGKQVDGTWRVLVDHGAPHPEEVAPTPLGYPPHNRATATRRNVRADTALSSAALLAADRAFAAEAARGGVRRAYLAVVADDVRIYRPGSLPAVGRAAVSGVFGRRAVPLDWVPERAGASVSGTLGYTIGNANYADQAEDAASAYLRIWRKEANRWKLVVDLLPAPPGDPSDE